MKMVMKMNVEGKRKRGKPKKRWLDTNDKCVDVENRDEWRFRTKVANP
jgi:hypothetical protein